MRWHIGTRQLGGVRIIDLKELAESEKAEARDIRETVKSFIADGETKLLVNLAAVDYMDSSGLATLVESLQRLISKGAAMRLVACKDEIRFVIELARLDRIFKLDATMEDSLRHLGASAT